jgi:hypothetical protein
MQCLEHSWCDYLKFVFSNVELRKWHRHGKTETVMILRMKKLLHFCTNVHEFSPGRLKILRLKSSEVSKENTYISQEIKTDTKAYPRTDDGITNSVCAVRIY